MENVFFYLSILAFALCVNTVQSQGNPCVQITCKFDAQCQANPGILTNARCVCPAPRCHPVNAPVCGVNGVTYTSECWLHIDECRAQSSISIKNRGACKSDNMVQPPNTNGSRVLLPVTWYTLMTSFLLFTFFF